MARPVPGLADRDLGDRPGNYDPLPLHQGHRILISRFTGEPITINCRDCGPHPILEHEPERAEGFFVRLDEMIAILRDSGKEPRQIRMSSDISHMLIGDRGPLATAYRIHTTCDPSLPPNSLIVDPNDSP